EGEGQSGHSIELERTRSESLSQKRMKLPSASAVGESQQQPINIDDSGAGYEEIQLSLLTIGDWGEIALAVPQERESARRRLSEPESLSDPKIVLSETQKPKPDTSSSASRLESQQLPGSNNNNGCCCDPDRAIAEVNTPPHPSTQSSLTQPNGEEAKDSAPLDAVVINSVPPKHRHEGQELVERLTQVAQDTPENLEEILIVYVEYARLLPQATTWVWQALADWVKEAIATQFPEYYQRLSLAIPQDENSIISSAQKSQPELSSPSSPSFPSFPYLPCSHSVCCHRC
ncbi:MAG: hypothetical protein ACRDEA_23365, partial [Microcystaceae cyanobacterium]